MDLKKDISKKIKQHFKNKKDEIILIQDITNELKNIIQISKKSGLSLRYTIYCILETIDEELSNNNLFSKEKFFPQIINNIITILQDIIKKNLINIDKNIKIYNEDIEEITEGIKEYIWENKYKFL